MVIVTKVGARRGADKSWVPALSRQDLIDGVHDNLKSRSSKSRRRESTRRWTRGTVGGIDYRTPRGARRAQAQGTDSPYRFEQRYARAVGGSTKPDRHRVRAKLLQRCASKR